MEILREIHGISIVLGSIIFITMMVVMALLAIFLIGVAVLERKESRLFKAFIAFLFLTFGYVSVAGAYNWYIGEVHSNFLSILGYGSVSTTLLLGLNHMLKKL